MNYKWQIAPLEIARMKDRLTEGFTEFLARNWMAGGRRDFYGVRVDEVSEDGSSFDLTLTFKAGEQYCCCEPGCHTGLNDPDVWSELRRVFERRVSVSVG